MKSLSLRFAATFVAIIVLLAAYDAWHSPRGRAPSTHDDHAFGPARLPAPAVRAESAAVDGDDGATHAMLAALPQANAILAGDIAATTGVRVALTECYYTQGRWPDTPASCGIDPAAYRGQLLERVRIEADGRYVAVLRAGHGLPAGEIRFTPTSSGTALRWECSTPSYPDIARVLPACRYEPRASASLATPARTGS